MDNGGAATVGRRLAWLLRREVPLEEALRRTAATSPRVGAALEPVRAQVARGGTLAQALQAGGQAFPALFVQGVVHGGDDPAVALVETARRLDEVRGYRQDLEAALTYPRFLLVGLALLTLSLYFWAGPAHIAPSSRLADAVSTPLFPLLTVPGLAVLLWILSPVGSADALRWRLPVLGPWLRCREAAGLLTWLEHGLAAGLPLDQALALAAGSSRSATYRASLEEALSSVRQGSTLTQALEGRIPGLTLFLVGRAESQGFPPGRLAQAAGMLARELRLAAERGLEFLVPMLLMLVGATLILIFVALYKPLLGSLGYLN